MPDRVWRETYKAGSHTIHEYCSTNPDDAEPGLWFATTPEALIALKDRIATRIGFDTECSVVDADECAWSILAILGWDGTDDS